MEQFEVVILCSELDGESLTNSSDIYGVGLGIGGLGWIIREFQGLASSTNA